MEPLKYCVQRLHKDMCSSGGPEEPCAVLQTLQINCKQKNIHRGRLSRKAIYFVFLSVTVPTDNASVSFVKYKGDYFVSTETNFMHKVNPENLETLEKVPS